MAMASTFSLAAVLLICVCLVSAQSGEDLQLSCPEKMMLTTARHANLVTLTCTVEKSAYDSGCSLITNVEFSLTKDGSKFLWAQYKYDCSSSPSNGFTTTSTCITEDVKCIGNNATHGTYTMSFYPSADITNGNFSCDVNCVINPGFIKPTLVVSPGCNDVIPVDPCGGCPDGEGCDESKNPPKCVGPTTTPCDKFPCICIIVTVLLSVLIVILVIIIILLCTQPSFVRRIMCCACCIIGIPCCCALCKMVDENKRLREENEKQCQKCGTMSETPMNAGRSQ